MKPIETPETTFTYKLGGGTKENDLPCSRENGEVTSVWRLDDEERVKVAETKVIYLYVWWPNFIGVRLDFGDEVHDQFEAIIVPDADDNPVLAYPTVLNERELRHLERGDIVLTVDMQPPPPVSLVVAEPPA